MCGDFSFWLICCVKIYFMTIFALGGVLEKYHTLHIVLFFYGCGLWVSALILVNYILKLMAYLQE